VRQELLNKIMMAAAHGKGVRLSQDDVRALASYEAISGAAYELWLRNEFPHDYKTFTDGSGRMCRHCRTIEAVFAQDCIPTRNGKHFDPPWIVARMRRAAQRVAKS